MFDTVYTRVLFEKFWVKMVGLHLGGRIICGSKKKSLTAEALQPNFH